MDLKEKRQVDAAREQVAKAKAHARPWRPIFLTTLAVSMAAVSRSARTAASEVLPETAFRALGHTGTEAVADAAAVAFGLLGGLAAILITLQLFGIGVTQLLVGGAFATVLVGIAAQQTLSNVFAGIVLLLARPVDVGDQVWIRSGALGGELRGAVTEIGITYVLLDTPQGPLHLPNSQVLAAAIAPAGNSDPDGPAPASSRPQKLAGPPGPRWLCARHDGHPQHRLARPMPGTGRGGSVRRLIKEREDEGTPL